MGLLPNVLTVFQCSHLLTSLTYSWDRELELFRLLLQKYSCLELVNFCAAISKQLGLCLSAEPRAVLL